MMETVVGDSQPSSFPDPRTGAKKRDYAWTVLAVDPLAFPLTGFLARKRWLTPDQVTIVSLILGLATGPLFGIGTRWSLAAGAIIYYLSFVFDCVDGKMARILNISSARGQALDAMADNARRASAILGIIFFLLHRAEDASAADVFLAATFGILSFYFMQISGAERDDSVEGVRGKWAAAMAKRRLLPTPGMPDVSAIVYFFGPLTLLVTPALWVGLVMVAAGILITWRRRLKV